MAACDYPHQPLTLRVHSSIKDLILDEGRAGLEDLEKRLCRPISIKADDTIHIEGYEIEAEEIIRGKE
jgi:hypothetical protein